MMDPVIPWIIKNSRLTLSLLLSTLIRNTWEIEIDNGVAGPPKIDCGVDSIRIGFNTQKTFYGNVFIKGHATDPRCHVAATMSQKVSIRVPHIHCNTIRSRSLNPPGIQIQTTVVISFHQAFITKVDRAYKVNCFYMEATKTVTANVDVSPQNEELITQTVVMPTCRYEVLRGGPNGPPVRYAQIGEPVYHKWTCDSQNEGIFCMLIHGCQVEDASGNLRHMLVDEAGCSIDRYLLQHIQYYGELSAGREAHVFKFADNPAIFFECQISLIVREDPSKPCPIPQCTALQYQELGSNLQNGFGGQRPQPHPQPHPQQPQPYTPPPIGGRGKRDVATWLKEQMQEGSANSAQTLDVISRRINVLDLEDDYSELPRAACEDYGRRRSGDYSGGNSGGDLYVEVERGGPGKVCVSTAAFTIVITATLLVAICTVVLLTIAVYRNAFRNIMLRRRDSNAS